MSASYVCIDVVTNVVVDVCDKVLSEEAGEEVELSEPSSTKGSRGYFPFSEDSASVCDDSVSTAEHTLSASGTSRP